MNKKNLKLKKLCVTHWFENLMMLQLNYYSRHNLFTNISLSSDDCAFCQEYMEWFHCLGCPISKKTGHVECDGSPYRKACFLKTHHNNNNKKNYEKAFDAIADEINFLVEL